MCDILLTPGSSCSTSSSPSATCSGTPWGGRSASLATSKRTSISPQHPFQARFSPDFYCNINWNNVPVNTPHKCLMFCCQFSSSASHGGVWNNRNNAATWARHSKQCVIHFNVLSPSHKESVHICSLYFKPCFQTSCTRSWLTSRTWWRSTAGWRGQSWPRPTTTPRSAPARTSECGHYYKLNSPQTIKIAIELIFK